MYSFCFFQLFSEYQILIIIMFPTFFKAFFVLVDIKKLYKGSRYHYLHFIRNWGNERLNDPVGTWQSEEMHSSPETHSNDWFVRTKGGMFWTGKGSCCFDFSFVFSKANKKFLISFFWFENQEPLSKSDGNQEENVFF